MYSELQTVLPLVAKPIRYTGGEMGARGPDGRQGRVAVALVAPDVYEIGMSNFGLRILYHVLNRRPDTICERACTPWPDMADRLRGAGVGLYGLESGRPLREFDLLGFTLQSELSYTNLLYTLDLAGIPLKSEDRTAGGPLVVAGGPCTVNPLPLKPFVDCFVVGDGEEVVGELIDALRDSDRSRRGETLDRLARIPGVYVPVRHESDPVVRRLVPELRSEDFPIPPLLPICEIIHDRLTLEIARGCCRGCRFCQAGMLNRPYRCRPVDELVRLAERGIKDTGWEELSLLSLSALDYPDLLELIQRLNATLSQRRVAVSLPSVRGEDFTPELAQALKAVKKTGLTFAPETASPRLRALVNKNVSEEKILASVQTAAAAGWSGVKLYFMIGLPGETAADAAEIARLVREVSRAGRGGQIRFNLSPFVPKPHTPLQWAGFESLAVLDDRIRGLKETLHRRNLKAKWENPQASWVQALLSRGDERLAPVIEHVYRQGGVFQEWTEHFDFTLWQQGLEAVGLDAECYLRARDPGEPLAWDFVNVGVDKDFLKQEFERARTGVMTPDCRTGECRNCGACGPEAGTEPATARVAADIQAGFGPAVDYGRYRRKIVTREQLKMCFRVKYAVGEEFRYAGHLDVVRAFYRALRRSELPIAYSQGFAPRPQVAFGPPLPVGLVSDGEYIDVQMEGHYPGNLAPDLGRFMPQGLRIVAARPLLARGDSLGVLLQAAAYRVETRGVSDADRAAARERSQGIDGVLGLQFMNFAQPPAPGIDGVPAALTLSLKPGVKLFAMLERLFVRAASEVRCWRVKREECLVVKSDGLFSPMED